MEYLQYRNQWIHRWLVGVLNLVINGIPSIQGNISHLHYGLIVLNLVINGIPSILWWKGHFYEF